MKSLRIFVFIAAAWLGIALPAAAQVLYGANGAGGNPATSLVTIDPANGAVSSTVGPIGFAVTGLAMHPLTGVLYGSTGGSSPVSPNSIITINTTTGAGTLVGATGLGNPVADITFRADGTLFGWSEDSDDLVTINTATGAATVVGDSALGTFGSGLTFSGSVLYFAGNGAGGDFYSINPATGAATVLSTLSGSAFGNAISAMASRGGVIYAVDFAGGGAPGAANLVTINPGTGVMTTLGPTQPGLDAIAFATAAPAPAPMPVPTMSQWTLLLLTLLMVSSAFLLGRKKRN